MLRRLFGYFIFCAVLLAGSASAAFAAGNLSVTLHDDSASVSRPVSTTAELIKFNLNATGGDVVVALIKMKLTGGLVADRMYFFVEDTNALIGSADGKETTLVFNGVLVKNDKPKTLVLRADMRGPSTSPVSVEVTEMVLGSGNVVGLPLKGPAVNFGGNTTTEPAAPKTTTENSKEAVDGQKKEALKETEKNSVSTEVTARERKLMAKTDQGLINRIKGRILLQVEGKGEAWYVEPLGGEKHYLRDGTSAYAALRRFGLGISNADLKKIPLGLEKRFAEKDSDQDGLPDKLEEAVGTRIDDPDSDDDGFKDGDEVTRGFSPTGPGNLVTDKALVSRLSGKILLQVESRGEAWYVNPADGRRYYMTDGPAAYQIMRFLSLGVTNTDLRKIPVGNE